MRALPSLLAFLAALALRLNVYGAQAAEDASRVGVVDKVENEAQVISASGAVTATVGAPVHLKDELRTGANARLQVTFLDETQLTLGEHASVVIDRYVYDLDRGIGETVLQATKGAFRFATGRIKEMKDSNIAVSTPFADIAVRAPNSGADRWTNMGFCCSKGKSRSRTRQGASCLVNLDRVPIFPRRSTRPALPLRGPPGRSPAPLRPSPCTDGE